MRRLTGLCVGAAIALSAAPASPALAATEFGNDCAANASEPGYTMLQLGRAPGASLPLTAPTDGVITQWSVRIAPGFPVEAAPVRLEVFRATPNPAEFQAVGESAEVGVGQSKFSARTRIPVLAGDRLGLYGSAGDGTLTCNTGAPEDELGRIKGTAPFDSVNAFAPVAGFRVAVSATLEPDLDQDGYGDETQDACPQLKAVHEGCGLSVEVFPLARRHSILAVVAASPKASVRVTGTVHLESRQVGGARLASNRGLVLNSGTHEVSAGTVGRINLRFSRRLEALLGRMSPRETVNVTVKAFASGFNGDRRYDVTGVRLKGRRRLPVRPTRKRGPGRVVGSRPVATLPG
jgi:hypothetical protein